MQARSLPYAMLSSVSVALVLLVGAPTAAAHRGSPASVASNYEARLVGFRPAIAGLTAHVSGGDINLELHVPAGREVLVLGVEGEPFLRFAGGRVFANEHSPTAASERVVTLTSEALSGPPLWHELRKGRSFTWHEHRLRPASAHRDGLVAPIDIPLRIAGARVMLSGASWHAQAPTPLVWLGPLLAMCAAAAAALRWRGGLTRLVLPLTLAAVASVLASIVGSTLYAPHSTLSAGSEIGAAGLLGLGAVVALEVVPGAQRPFVATATGGLCLLFAVSAFPVLTHGFALSRLPSGIARTATVVALIAAGLLILIGGIELFEQSDKPGRRPKPHREARSR